MSLHKYMDFTFKVPPVPEPEEKRGRGKSNGKYQNYSSSRRFENGRYAAEHGNKFAQEKYKLPESTVRCFKKKYQAALKDAAKANSKSSKDGGSTVFIMTKEITGKVRGRKSLLGAELDGKLRQYIHKVRAAGGCVNSNIVKAAAEGLVKKEKPSLSSIIHLSKDWAYYQLKRMGFSKRRVTKAARKKPADAELTKNLFVQYVQREVEKFSIPTQFIINFDQTGLPLVPCSSWTMNATGEKQISMVGADDKSMITALFTITAGGSFLPPQLIYDGKTPRCVPKPAVPFPEDWDVTFSANHWSNEQTMLQYVNMILLPYIQRERLQLTNKQQRALVICDVFAAHRTDAFKKILEDNGISMVYVPAGGTDELQPLDVSVNKVAKSLLREEFNKWYASEVASLNADDLQSVVDLRMSILKPLHAQWVMSTCDQIRKLSAVIVRGFTQAGITDRSEDGANADTEDYYSSTCN